MSNTTIAIIVLVIIVLGGGWWYVSSTPASTTDDAAGGTTEAGSENAGVSDTPEIPSTDEGAAAGSAMPVPGTDAEEKVVVREFTVSGAPFKFTPGTLTVKKGETVSITFKNTSGSHDFVLDEFGVKTKLLTAGKEETVQFVADKAGSFKYYCSVGTHRQQGMEGTLTVTE